MQLNRNITNTINWILDNLIPPIIRDSKIFIYPLFKILFKNKASFFYNFKDDCTANISDERVLQYYIETADVHIKRETDLNRESVEQIMTEIEGESVLDIASGRGFLAKKIVSELGKKVTGIDFVVDEKLASSVNPKFEVGNIESIQYPDNFFDTVVCTHTLEHVFNLQLALNEVRRVCKQKLIIVLPRQREYKYTFDLHIHFFPYKHTVLKTMRNEKGKCIRIKNDWLYIESAFL